FVFFTQCRSSRVTFRNGVRKIAEYTQCRNQLPKLLGVFGVGGDGGFQVDSLTGLEPIRELFDQVGKEAIAPVRDGAGSDRKGGHVISSAKSSPSRLRNRWSARRGRDFTALAPMPRTAAISAVESCSRCRSTRISRSRAGSIASAAWTRARNST